MNNVFLPRPLALALLISLGGVATTRAEAGAGGPAPAPEAPAAVPSAASRGSVTNIFQIRGMHCEGCAKGITGEVRALPGVGSVEVSYARKLAVVASDTNRVSEALSIRTIHEAGYEASVVKPGKGARR